MKRVGKIALILAACMLVASPALAEKKIRWKLAMSWSSTLTPLASPAPKLAKLVSEMTGGNFEIRVEGAEKHKAPLGILDMVKGGQFEMGHTASYYWKGKDITSVFFTTVPFGMTAPEQFSWLHYGDGQKLQDKLYDKFDVYSYPGGNTGVQMGGWFRKEIKSLDDLKGLKMRIPGLAGEVFAKLGVNVTNIAPGELYTSLDRGTIDALEWVGPAMDFKMGFHKIAPFYYAGWHEPASDMQFLINKKAFAKLPKAYQTILLTAIEAVAADMFGDNFDASATAWAEMKKEYPNIKVMIFPEPVLKAMKKATDEVMDGYAAQNPEFKEVYESQKAYMAKAREWTKMSTLYYLQTSEMVGK
ncbi:ABC transporter substrate-binding protein [Desulfopila sp. IMCC35006]|uniref:TRAP transporter substrate-binding protein n=1 Tax=Desulfopila sp. IMCC35006 TaxID=2569542 RepID=UPI0010ACECBB|nr:TRAP transporter substrate-binding protein DctP [Desulfopila sp. IMCC35006]TKB25031.1 ABC transporter substrate-binding protein [Desulfopila sp. IMCC35006]